MRLKLWPIAPVRADNFEVDRRPASKPPPRLGALESARGRVEYPVRLEPIEHVVVWGQQDDLAVPRAAPGLLESEGTDAGDLAVDDAGEFVDHGGLGRLDDQARHVGAELLAHGEDCVGPEP